MHQQREIRCSDAEREAISGELRRHAVEGRLDPTELDDRLGQALQARTRPELYATLHGLPTLSDGHSSHQRPTKTLPTTATATIIAVLALALWVTGHLGEDGMMFIIAAAVLIVVWRRPRPRRDQ